MATVEQTLSELQPGTKVTLKLKNGSEVSGTFQGQQDEGITLADGDQDHVLADQIDGVIVDFSLPAGPE